MAKLKLIVFIIGLTLLTFSALKAVEVDTVGLKIIPDRVNEEMKIDAELTESVWSKTPINEEFVSFSPVFGESVPQKTTVWAAYDSDNLYFAFKCTDPEPSKIKASMSQRDRIFRDDMICVTIDAIGNRQSSYEFYVNPFGIQADALNSASSGTDTHPDFVWKSAGKLTDFGFQVEMCIPLKSISCKSGKEVEMRMLFIRQISRLGMVVSWPKFKPGQTDFNSMTSAIYKDLRAGLKLDILPNFVFSSNKERATDTQWNKAEITKDFGLGIKYGITSSITADLAINPDFSQVESDAFQVEVNRRYPVFNTEKRPFFMEGAKTFDFGLTEYNYLQFGVMGAAIHTRRIVNPGWAAKLSGSAGNMNFGFLVANDRTPEQTWANIPDEDKDKDALWAIGRVKYNLGSDNSIGLLYSGSFLGDGRNNTIGTDLQYRIFKGLRFYANYLHTNTKYATDIESKSGNGFNSILQYISPKFNAWALYERYDKNFNMNSAFIDRIGISQGRLFLGPNFYTKIKGIKWIRKIQPWVLVKKLEDLYTDMDDTAFGGGVNVYFSNIGVMELSWHDEKEAWQYQDFRMRYFHFWLYTQMFKWLRTQVYFWTGDQIYYDPVDPFMGKGPRGILELTIEPTPNLRMVTEWTFNNLSRKSNNEKIFSINVFNFTATYQFNRYFLLRSVLRYNDYEKKLLTDLLASFTLIPGTVMHLGYGSIYENKNWVNNEWVPGMGYHLTNMKNSLFLKLSYLWQIK